MTRKKNSRQRRNPWSRKHKAQHDYQNLEPRYLLASTFGELHVGSPIADAFSDNAVTPMDMIERASVMPYAKGELVVAIRTSRFNATRLSEQVNWERYVGIEGAQSLRQMMSVPVNARQNVTLVHLDVGDADIFELMRQLDENPEVMWSAPNFQIEGDMREFVPNDPEYPNQYHHPLMQNDDAWDITLGSPDIIIGVTDDGVELLHSDLNANIWQNIDDFPFDGIDNDGNGYIDDFNGWDFSSGNNDPNPNDAADTHGTHVAGIAAGRTDNNVGISGTSGGSTIMPLQFYGVGAWTAAVINETFTYAADNGANIVNTSYNIDGWVGDPVFTAGLQYLYDNGVLHFNSAGNGNAQDPPRQAFTQTLLVASTESDDTRSSFSNYGSGIDIAAPGGSILSTVTGNTYDTLSGTSMAAPNAAGAAALIWSAHPTWTRDQVAAQLAGTADDIDSLNPGFEGMLGYGRVNSFNGITGTLGAPQVDEVLGLPADGEYLDDTTIDQFSVSFTQIMDPASVNDSANWDLRAAGLDDVFGTGDDIVMNLSFDPYMIGTNDLMIDIVDGPMNYGHYMLTLNSGGLQNPFTTALDGNGDGTGGDSYFQEFWISPPLAGVVSFQRATFLVNDTVEIRVGDANAVTPVMVTVTSDGGDSETLTLTDQGSGLYSATINTVPGAAVPGDGQLNVQLDQVITVTYEDADDGTGNPGTSTDTAVISNIIRWDSTDTPINITSNNTITSTISITDAGRVADLDLELDITHTYDSDLDVFLIAPDGTRVELFQDIGGGGDNFTNTYLDDEASTPISSGSAPFTGSFQPVGSLATLDDMSITGDWTLEVTDDAAGDEGTLNWWSLYIDVRSFDEGTVAMDQDMYNVGNTINIEVVDSNATAPVQVTVDSDGGDSEVLTLTDQGGGVYSGSIVTVAGAPAADGQLQVAVGDTVTVTYEDQDDGTGAPATVTDTALITNIIRWDSSDTPIDITSNTTITSVINIPDNGKINDLDIELDITHTWDSDLDVFLIAPDGTRVELFTDVGGSGDNFTNTHLDDEAGTSITDGSAPFTGSFRPEGSLAVLDNTSITGDWTLEVTDDAGGDEGTLNSWSIFIDVGTFEAGTLDMDQEAYDVGDTINIEVIDSNAMAPVEVTVESGSGDVEVVTLTDMGGGVYSGSIVTVSGTPTGDGQLQVGVADSIVATYEDQDDGTGNPATVTDTAFIANVIEYPSSDVPIDITSNNTITSEIVITDEGFVRDVDVLLDITHTFDADLDVFLIAPDGTRVELFTDVGGGGDDFTQTRLDDEAATPISAGSAPFTGSFQPEGDLTLVDGISITGTWLLEVTDDAGGDEGTLNAWSLFIDVLPPPPAPDILVMDPADPAVEGDSGTTAVEFEVQLSEASSQVVTVDYATTVAGYADPAHPGGDFVEATGTVTFQPGETSQIVTIDVIGDYLIELDEQFGLELSNASGGVIAQGLATATIEDQDRFLQAKPLDFVTNDSPIASDTRGLTDLAYTPGKKIGWAAGATGLQFVDRSAHGDDFQRDLMLAEDAMLNIDIAGSGRFRVTVTYGDADVARDDMQVTVEGKVKPLVSTLAGEFITRTYMVTMNDGQMNIQFTDMGGSDNLVAIAGVQVQRVVRPPFGGGGGGAPPSSIIAWPDPNEDPEQPGTELQVNLDSPAQPSDEGDSVVDRNRTRLPQFGQTDAVQNDRLEQRAKKREHWIAVDQLIDVLDDLGI